MINPFIKLTEKKSTPIIINLIEICSMEQWEDANVKYVTVIGLKNGIFEKVTETPEEILDMIQKYYDKCMLSKFYASGLIEGKYHTSAIANNANALCKRFKDDKNA